jgi:hypothetical protein
MKTLHVVNGVLWLTDAVVSLAWAHSPPLGVIGMLGFCLASAMYWIEP